VGGVLLAILLAPGAIVVLLGLELLERRLFGSGPAATARLRPAQLRERERHPCRAMPGARRGGRLRCRRSTCGTADCRPISRCRRRDRWPLPATRSVSRALSERARGAFSALDVRSVPPQTIVFGELAEQSDLRDLLSLCGTMGLEVVSLRRLTADSPAAAREDERRPAATSRTPRPMRHPDPPG
jgi:hypothetical protein